MEASQAKSPLITVFVPFTRPWMVEDFLAMFDKISFPREKTELVFFNDTDNMELQAILSSYQASAGFMATTLYQSHKQAPGEVFVPDRRRRIVEMKQRSVGLIGDSKYVFCLEDDSFVEPHAFTRLYHLINKEDSLGIVSGVQKGRWGFPIVGAWQMDDVHNPTKVWTVPYKPEGLQRVDGVGWYCCLTHTYLYKSADYRFEAECLGPDTCYTMDLRRQGFHAVIDWDLVAKHRVNQNYLTPDDGVVSFRWYKEDGKWNVKEPIRTR